MIKSQKIYIALMIFASFSSYTVASDLLDSYIGKIMEKSDGSKAKLPKLVNESKSGVKASSEKSDKKDSAPVKDTVSKEAKPVKVEVVSDPNEATEIEKVSSATLRKTKVLRKKLRDSSLKSLSGGSGTKINSQLQDVLSQLQSLSFPQNGKPAKQDTKSSLKSKEVVTVPEVKLDAFNTVESVRLPKEKQPTVVLPEDSSGIVDVFELAESLFHIGDKAKALKYYRKALKVSLPVGKSANPKRAWILFQIGNCLYNVDSLEAIKIFEQQILEHPNSDWANCARTKKQVLKWFLVEKPMTLTMTEVK